MLALPLAATYELLPKYLLCISQVQLYHWSLCGPHWYLVENMAVGDSWHVKATRLQAG